MIHDLFSKINLAVIIYSLVSGAVVVARPICGTLFLQKSEVQTLVDIDAVKQWLKWEQQANFAIFRKSAEPVLVPHLQVDATALTTTLLPSAPTNLKSLIGSGEVISWFKHPANKNQRIPYFHETSKNHLSTYFTASRSLAVILENNVYTLKMATDYPHGPNTAFRPGKGSTQEDVQDGINRMHYIEKVDAQIGTDQDLILAKEVAIVADKKTGEGYLFRDLSFMNDGNYYLPALSLPYVGRQIAELNHENADLFWKKNYAAVLGRAKAKLLLRYGLQMETPNAQNMLIQLDRNLRPTGAIVFRDISDSILIEAVATGLGETETLENDLKLGVRNGASIEPFWWNSAWHFDEAGTDSIAKSTLENWGQAHDEAYKKEIETALSIQLDAFKNIDKNKKFDAAMSSSAVRAKLSSYRQRQILKYKTLQLIHREF